MELPDEVDLCCRDLPDSRYRRRYTHAHTGIMNRRDFDRMVDLLVAVLQKLDAAAVASVRSSSRSATAAARICG